MPVDTKAQTQQRWPLHQCCEEGEWCAACLTHHKLNDECDKMDAMSRKAKFVYAIELK